MTDKERLKEIKEIYRWAIENSIANRIADSDIEWLINRVEELEEEVEKQKSRKYLKMRQRDDFMKKAQRYKQALEFYADSKNWIPQNDDVLSEITMDYGSKARQALEGKEK
ncbi:hypothetical protein NSS91_16155 [Caldifermentibacillus hisashii]|uniref:hypothetical protein n=1 Tax=Caldifermentibacillus hisashii TaxID=996558 RepID=UPI0031FDB1DB